MLWLTGVIAFILAEVHLEAHRLKFLSVLPRSRWLSAASGVSVAYVFVHLLPELAVQREKVSRALASTVLARLDLHVYLIALVGLAVFYGLERMAEEHRPREAEVAPEGPAPAAVFWIHIGSFAVYNALIGYVLLHREQPGIRSLLFFAAAMGLHFVVNDFGLREHHRGQYRRQGRWVLSAAVVAGWAVGVFLELHDLAVAVIFAFLAGGVVLNVLKEELPRERQSRFSAFAAGAAAYAALLLFVG